MQASRVRAPEREFVSARKEETHAMARKFNPTGLGSRARVFHGNAHHTSGGLMTHKLDRNKYGRIVSKQKSEKGKKAFEVNPSMKIWRDAMLKHGIKGPAALKDNPQLLAKVRVTYNDLKRIFKEATVRLGLTAEDLKNQPGSRQHALILYEKKAGLPTTGAAAAAAGVPSTPAPSFSNAPSSTPERSPH